MNTPTLWHYTCDHAVKGIQDCGGLLPRFGVIWLTDLYRPRKAALGLTSRLISCDRTAHRFRVLDDRDCIPWLRARREGFFSPQMVMALEMSPGAEPYHWWIARQPVPVALDEVRR